MADIRDLLRREYYRQNPTAAFYQVAGPLIGGPNRNLSAWLEGQNDNFFKRYEGQAGFNQDEDYWTWLGKQDLMKPYMQQSPQQRGENWGRYMPQVRYRGY